MSEPGINKTALALQNYSVWVPQNKPKSETKMMSEPKPDWIEYSNLGELPFCTDKCPIYLTCGDFGLLHYNDDDICIPAIRDFVAEVKWAAREAELMQNNPDDPFGTIHREIRDRLLAALGKGK